MAENRRHSHTRNPLTVGTPFGTPHMRRLGVAAERDKRREIACFLDPAAGQTPEEAAKVLLTSNTVEDADCNWNSDYWRELGAPWGGA